MTWSYSPAETTALDRVRSRIGDVNVNRQLLTDEALLALLVASGQGEVVAAIAAIDRLLGLVVFDIDRSAIGISTTRSQKFQQLKDLRQMLLAERDLGARPYCGGLSHSERTEKRGDPDIIQPTFTMGMDDLPGTSTAPNERGES